MTQADVLIISDEAEFVRALVGRWCTQYPAPSLTVAAGAIWMEEAAAGYDLIILGGLRGRDSHSTLRSLRGRSGTPVLYVAQEEQPSSPQNAHSHFSVVQQRDQWPHTVLLVSGEILRRINAVKRARRAEQWALDCQRYATLGRYMIEMRPAINDTLTSVLGNADLLLLAEPPALGESRQQIQTIHRMVLRLNEIMRRFSSLFNETRGFDNVHSEGSPAAGPSESARVSSAPSTSEIPSPRR
jgi:hypothetical protein